MRKGRERRESACRENARCSEGQMLGSQHVSACAVSYLSFYLRCLACCMIDGNNQGNNQFKCHLFQAAFLGSSPVSQLDFHALGASVYPSSQQLCVRDNCRCASHPHSDVNS